VVTAFWQSSTGQFERGVPTQIVQIVGVGVTAGLFNALYMFVKG
jgi:hypothetical protein